MSHCSTIHIQYNRERPIFPRRNASTSLRFRVVPSFFILAPWSRCPNSPSVSSRAYTIPPASSTCSCEPLEEIPSGTDERCGSTVLEWQTVTDAPVIDWTCGVLSVFLELLPMDWFIAWIKCIYQIVSGIDSIQVLDSVYIIRSILWSFNFW